MKDSRKGESLWSEWDGMDFEPKLEVGEVTYFTYDHVDLDIEVVKRALASTLQRDGLVSSLGQAFNVLDTSSALSHGYSGFVDDDIVAIACDADGFTYSGSSVAEVIPTTWVEVWLPWV